MKDIISPESVLNNWGYMLISFAYLSFISLVKDIIPNRGKKGRQRKKCIKITLGIINTTKGTYRDALLYSRVNSSCQPCDHFFNRQKGLSSNLATCWFSPVEQLLPLELHLQLSPAFQRKLWKKNTNKLKRVGFSLFFFFALNERAVYLFLLKLK